jgi:alpha-aminoadipic semialdehyde synthase
MGATHNYKSSRAAKLAAYELGEDIKSGKLPKHFGALSFVFSGSGNVSQVNKIKLRERSAVYASFFAI